MVRFYDKGEEPDKEYWYETGNGRTMRLHQDNLLGNFHEEMDAEMNVKSSPDANYDRVAVQDPEDEQWWQYWRWDVGDETFNQLEYMVRRCGSYLIRQTVLDTIRTHFEVAHQASDAEISQFFETTDGSA